MDYYIGLNTEEKPQTKPKNRINNNTYNDVVQCVYIHAHQYIVYALPF